MADPMIFVIFLHGRKSNPMIPAAFFSTHLEGKHQSMKLKLTSDASDKIWEVRLDGRRLADGWENFSAVHGLRDDDVLVFMDKGNMFFHVTPSGRSFCQVQCISSEEDDIWDDVSDSKNIASKKKPRTEAESSSKSSYLLAHVTSSNLRRDRLCLLRGFARSNGLNERCCEIDLMNQHGKSWTLYLRYNRTIDQACISRGWRDFCFANGLEDGSFYGFKLVQNGTRPLLRLCSDTIPEGNCSKANGKDHLSENSSIDCSESSSSMKQSKFLTLTFEPYMLKSGQLRLSRPFARENGIKEAGEINLVDKYGVKWPSYLVPANEQGDFYMAEGWINFCAANRLEMGESFTLQFVRGKGTTPMLKFCSKAKIVQVPFDGPRRTGQASRGEEEEAQEETETQVQKSARVSAEGGSSRRSLASNRSTTDLENLRRKEPFKPCSISDQIKKVKQSIKDTLSGVRRFQSELEIKEQNFEASLEEIDVLEEKVLETNKILNSRKIQSKS